jgi:hypothetical protein
MKPVTIIINNRKVMLGEPLPKSIANLEISCFPGVSIPLEQAPLIKQWLNQIVDNVDCEYVTYNKVLIPSNELKKF